jgi:hypothetical protein
VTPVIVKVDPVGYWSLGDMLVVLGTFGCLVSVSLTASITGVTTVLVQLAPTGQLGSPPPLTVAVLLAVRTPAEPLAATLTGTVMTMLPVATPDAMEHPARLLAPAAPAVIQLPGVNVPPLTLMPALVVMPAGKVSAIVIAAVVGPLATPIVIV